MNEGVRVFGLRLVGVNAVNGRKLLLSVVFVSVVWAAGRLLRYVIRGHGDSERRAFWVRQGISIATTLINIIALLSIWFDDPTRLTTAAGMLTAGLAFALQRVITALAGYVVILRGKTFNVGDRITMGGIRGDVVALGFLQTVIMEMGQPPEVQSADPAMWVQARQYSGRIVTVTNDKIFDNPVFNYSREFPFLWEEMHLPVPFAADRNRAEEILLKAARTHTKNIKELGEDALVELERRYFVKRSELEPRVFLRITDNWIELSLRFLVEDHGIRQVKDGMSRDILADLEQAGIGIASGTYEIVGMPPLKVEIAPPPAGYTSPGS